MPSSAEMKQYLGGQTFGKTPLPKVDLSGNVYIITGANTGIGFESARQLASLNAATLILACRNLSKGEAAKKIILDLYPRTKTEVWHVDLCDHSSIISFAQRVRNNLPRLDGFVANAGIEPANFELVEGCESTITVNVISTFLLCILVLPKLKESAEKYTTRTNLSFVGSMQQIFAPHDQLQVPDIFAALSRKDGADMTGRYGLSKLMVQLCTRELALRLGQNSKVVVNVVNPGWCDTGLSSKGFIAGLIFRLIGRTAEAGGKTLAHAVTAGMETHGKYLSECQIKNESEFARSEEGKKMQKTLWTALGKRLETVKSGVMVDFVDR